MKANVVSWTDSEMKKVVRREIDVSPVAYRTAPYAYWKLVVAKEDLEVGRGDIAFIDIEKIKIPGNTIVSPLSLMRNELGIVLDVYESYPPRVKIEDPKDIERAAFLAVKDGEIKKGDLLGVVKVFIVGLGKLEEMTKVKPPEMEVVLVEKDVNLVYGGRKKVRVKEYRYRRRHIAEWLPVVSEENLTVEKGKAVEIKIRDLKLPPQTIPVLLSIMRHPLGTLIDLVCRDGPRRIEEGVVVDRAIFMPMESGEVKKGDLIGVMNNYYISLGKMPSERPMLGSQEVNLVFRKDGKIVRKRLELQPFGFKRSEIGILQPVVAAEDVEFRKGEVKSIPIEEINLPNSTVVQPLHERNHPFGVMIDVMEDRPRLVEEDRRIVNAVFFAHTDGEVRKGDLIGVLNVYHVAILSPAQMMSFGVF